MLKNLSTCALVLAVAVLAACSTTTGNSNDPETRRATIDSNVDAALQNLYNQVEGSQQLVNSAKGVLVFPSVLEAGFVFGAASGVGALRVNGESVSYHRTSSGSWGLQAGAQSTAAFILFMTEDALRNFEQSEGWSVGTDANVTLVNVGANARVSTHTAQQ